ncbi:MAG: hypothetical protein DDT23_01155 [candidate division WS2 bacterium]|nr:hypothetical protein [Candidatus Lithacetigena glycinireducens]
MKGNQGVKGVPGYSTTITRSKIVILTGAGVSKPLGFETLDGLFELVEKTVSGEELRLLTELEQYIERASFELPDLEVVLEILEKFVGTKDLSEILGKPGSALVSEVNVGLKLRETILEFLLEHFEFSRRKTDEIRDLYEPFFYVISSYTGSNVIPIFTTNYDRVIEQLHDGRQLKVNYGFRHDPPSAATIWDPSEFNNFTPSGSKVTDLILFKLHGSIKWYKEKNTDRVECIDRKLAKVELSEHLENAVLYPTQTKSVTEDPYLTCYDYFEECLRNAELLIVIGHSFGDDYLNHVIKKAFSVNQQLEIVVFNPGFEKPNRRKKFDQLSLPKDRSHVFYHCFDYGKKGECLLNQTKREIVRKLGPVEIFCDSLDGNLDKWDKVKGDARVATAPDGKTALYLKHIGEPINTYLLAKLDLPDASITAGIIECEVFLSSENCIVDVVFDVDPSDSGKNYMARFDSRYGFGDCLLIATENEKWHEMKGQTSVKNVSPPGEWHCMKVEFKRLENGQISMKLHNNYKEVASTVDSTYSSGRIGMFNELGDIYIKNFRVKATELVSLPSNNENVN